jgi:hypothetical protein
MMCLINAAAVFLLSAAAFLFFAPVIHYTLPCIERERGSISLFYGVGDTIISLKDSSGAAGTG